MSVLVSARLSMHQSTITKEITENNKDIEIMLSEPKD